MVWEVTYFDFQSYSKAATAITFIFWAGKKQQKLSGSGFCLFHCEALCFRSYDLKQEKNCTTCGQKTIKNPLNTHEVENAYFMLPGM